MAEMEEVRQWAGIDILLKVGRIALFRPNKGIRS